MTTGLLLSLGAVESLSKHWPAISVVQFAYDLAINSRSLGDEFKCQRAVEKLV